MDGLQWKVLLKWMIWGYQYFRKRPFQYRILIQSDSGTKNGVRCFIDDCTVSSWPFVCF